MLHYRIIGFSVPPHRGFSSYTLQIARGHYTDEKAFADNIILKAGGKTTKILAKVPYWGTEYTWRVLYNTPGEFVLEPTVCPLLHFSTGMVDNVDTTKVRLNVKTRDRLHKGAFVFLDFNKVLYDMDGQPVWYLPRINNTNFENAGVRDMKLTSDGTITFLMNDVPYEVAYNGRVLWRGPNDGRVSGDSVEHYHHEFTRLKNGHYMVLGNEDALWPPGGRQGGNAPVMGNSEARKMPFGTVIEYDKAGRVIWQWKSSKYYANTNIACEGAPPGRYDIHQNGFYFDEDLKFVYVSFKNISEVVKVKYPTGEVVRTYKNSSLFCHQHNCSRQGGGLLVFNNNVCNENPVPKIVILQEPKASGEALKKAWEFAMPVNSTNNAKEAELKLTSGGSAMELGDKTIFASNCTPYADIIIVNRKKETLFHAVPESWEPLTNSWFVVPQYRASIIEHGKDLEKAVWHE
jgi:hypothetical protein